MKRSASSHSKPGENGTASPSTTAAITAMVMARRRPMRSASSDQKSTEAGQAQGRGGDRQCRIGLAHRQVAGQFRQHALDRVQLGEGGNPGGKQRQDHPAVAAAAVDVAVPGR